MRSISLWTAVFTTFVAISMLIGDVHAQRTSCKDNTRSYYNDASARSQRTSHEIWRLGCHTLTMHVMSADFAFALSGRAVYGTAEPICLCCSGIQKSSATGVFSRVTSTPRCVETSRRATAMNKTKCRARRPMSDAGLDVRRKKPNRTSTLAGRDHRKPVD